MAKKTHIKVRMVPEAKPDSPFFYYVKKPAGGEKAKVKLSAKKYNLKKLVNLSDLTDLPYIEITNLLSIYTKPGIMYYLIENEINMNFYLKTDSYTSALAIIHEGIGIGIIDDITIEKAKLNLVNISDIKDSSFEYRINATMKKNNIRKECNEFFNYLAK